MTVQPELHELRLRFRKCRDIIGLAQDDSLGNDARLSLANLSWITREGLELIEDLPIDKLSRWLGFSEGCLAMRGQLAPSFDIDAAMRTDIAISAIPTTDLTALEGATATIFRRYREILSDSSIQSPLQGAPVDTEQVYRLCCDGEAGIVNRSIAESSIWLGFAQGCLCMHRIIDVDTERDVSRPLFHRAYHEEYGAAPASYERQT